MESIDEYHVRQQAGSGGFLFKGTNTLCHTSHRDRQDMDRSVDDFIGPSIRRPDPSSASAWRAHNTHAHTKARTNIAFVCSSFCSLLYVPTPAHEVCQMFCHPISGRESHHKKILPLFRRNLGDMNLFSLEGKHKQKKLLRPIANFLRLKSSFDLALFPDGTDWGLGALAEFAASLQGAAG